VSQFVAPLCFTTSCSSFFRKELFLLKGSTKMTERSNTGCGEIASASCSGSGPQCQYEAHSATDVFVSHQDISNISTSSSSASIQSSNGWCIEQSVADVDIVEMTDWTDDVSNVDTGPDPLITVTEDESPKHTFSEGDHVTVSEVLADEETATDTAAAAAAASLSVEDGFTVSVTEVEVVETEEAADVAMEIEEDEDNHDHDHDITAHVPYDETSDVITDEPGEPVVAMQVCEKY
jgi:hypothetical protein